MFNSSQIRIQARDNGVPFRFSTKVCQLTITRNFQVPIFNPRSYIQTVPETLPLGDVILTVTAVDNDPLVRFCCFHLCLQKNT